MEKYEVIQIRCSPEEKEAWRAVAEGYRVNFSIWVRGVLNKELYDGKKLNSEKNPDLDNGARVSGSVSGASGSQLPQSKGGRASGNDAARRDLAVAAQAVQNMEKGGRKRRDHGPQTRVSPVTTEEDKTRYEKEE